MRTGFKVAVTVLGDLSRSPRMRNHALELAADGFQVFLIGYCERAFDPPSGVRVVALHPIAPPRARMLYALVSAVRMSLLYLELMLVFVRCRPHRLLVQSPPSLPVLAAAQLLRIPVVVDWHNYSWTLLALRFGHGHWLVRLLERWEFRAARRAVAHLCVSQAMCSDLESRGILARLLYDRPLEISHPADRPPGGKLVVVCPAGWTGDEEMGLLLDSIALLPPELAEIHLTGDGPLRSQFEGRIQSLRERGFEIHTGFLPEPAYRALLRRAHIGLSLHRSSSGLDLAMKVVDLFGAGVGVCALDYGPVLREQVVQGQTGYLFSTAGELAGILACRSGLEKIRPAPMETWSEAWRRNVAPLFHASAT